MSSLQSWRGWLLESRIGSTILSGQLLQLIYPFTMSEREDQGLKMFYEAEFGIVEN